MGSTVFTCTSVYLFIFMVDNHEVTKLQEQQNDLDSPGYSRFDYEAYQDSSGDDCEPYWAHVHRRSPNHRQRVLQTLSTLNSPRLNSPRSRSRSPLMNLSQHRCDATRQLIDDNPQNLKVPSRQVAIGNVSARHVRALNIQQGQMEQNLNVLPPCVTCGEPTENWCEGCEHTPKPFWPGHHPGPEFFKHTPLCTLCEIAFHTCSLCIKPSWTLP